MYQRRRGPHALTPGPVDAVAGVVDGDDAGVQSSYPLRLEHLGYSKGLQKHLHSLQQVLRACLLLLVAELHRWMPGW